ncbi:hypothetical protein FOA52_000788 [Chlamydomonas sp. UWO 241]|nr:hypothetical protein FOA52_000788 [Chlamydomonas sp. UWO 241]
MILPGCQDTGTATVIGKRGQYVWTDGKDNEALSLGIYRAFTETNLRYSQVAPLDMFTEKNTGTNLPAQIDDEPLAPPSGYDEGMQGGEGMSALARQHAAMHEVAMRQADAMRADARRNHAATETRLSGLETALGGLGSGYGRMNAEVIRLGLGLTAMEERTAGHEALVREDTKARQVQYSRDLASRASKDELGAHAAAQQRDTAALRDEIRQAAGMGPTGNVRAAIIAERRETRCNRMFKVIIPQRVTDRPLELADKLHTWLIRPELLGKPPPAAGPLVFEDAWVLRPKGGETSSQEGTKAAFVVASPLLARWVHSRLAAVSAAGVSISVERTPAQQQAWLPLKALFAQAMQEGRKLYAAPGGQYDFLFITKGGGSANKTSFFQQTKQLLNPTALTKFMEQQIKALGTAACPPYHLAVVIGGTSAELTVKTVKMASTRSLDGLLTTGNDYGRAFRDLAWEEKLLEMTRKAGIGAQFGGKYFCHDVRVIRLPRHGASCPVGVGVSCSADRQAMAKITPDGLFIEALERNPAKYLPDVSEEKLSSDVVHVDLNRPMADIVKQLSQYPIRTRLALTGTLVVARDSAHAKLKENLEAGKGLPQYAKDHIIYYAGPAKTPEGYASGSFGPTTAGRMDAYIDPFMAAGGSMITLAKGNRSKQVTTACKKYGGFYLGSIGGPAAVLAQNNIKKVEMLEFAELGMEAVWKIEVVDFPAFIVVDCKGDDFFEELLGVKGVEEVLDLE